MPETTIGPDEDINKPIVKMKLCQRSGMLPAEQLHVVHDCNWQHEGASLTSALENKIELPGVGRLPQKALFTIRPDCGYRGRVTERPGVLQSRNCPAHFIEVPDVILIGQGNVVETEKIGLCDQFAKIRASRPCADLVEANSYSFRMLGGIIGDDCRRAIRGLVVLNQQ